MAFENGEKNCAESMLPSAIQQELAEFESGDILFMVPVEWAEVPFELFHVAGEFLCRRFAVGDTFFWVLAQAPAEKASTTTPTAGASLLVFHEIAY